MTAWSRVSLAVLLLCTLALGLFGIGRSLWLDEAWVANSIHASSLREMFYYPDWLQTSPPSFLLLSRAVVHLAGLSNLSFRLVPLAFALIATAAMFALSRRVLSLPWAVLASALIVFHPAFIEYSHSAKQYSGEVAATVVVLLALARYFESPGRREILWLLAALVLGLTFAYSIAFLLPGLLVAVYFTSKRTAAILGVSAGLTLLVLWAVLIRFNTAPELRAFWAADADALFTPSLVAGVLLVLTIVIWLLVHGPLGARQRTQLACAIPCLLLALASVSGWYPASQRMRLWVLPCFILACLITAEHLFGTRRFGAVVLALAVLFAAINVRNQIREGRDLAEEDFSGAFQYLKDHAGTHDLILVHAAAREGFRLYSDILGWSGSPPVYGNTGWPCCARGKDARPGQSAEAAVVRDVTSMIPHGFSGQIWLFYSTRPSHWKYVGLNEGDLWRKTAWERGCPPGPYMALKNLAVSPMECGASAAAHSARILPPLR
jgi:hypothetical protein